MPKLSDMIQGDPVRALVWSITGGGKTTLIGRAVEFEEFWPMYVFDWDLRIASLRATLPSDWFDRISVDPYRDVQIGGEAFARMEAKVQMLEREGFKSVVIDSATFMAKGIMNRVLMLAGRQITSNPQLQDYLTLQSIQEDIIGRLCSKKLHIFVTCHEDNQRDEVTSRVFKNVDLNGKSANKIPGYFNEVWHCETNISQGESKFVVRTRSDHTYMARTSFKTLGNTEAQTDLWKKIVAELRARPTQSQSTSIPTSGTQVGGSFKPLGTGQITAGLIAR